MIKKPLLSLVISGLLFVSGAKTFYVDPAEGNPAYDGSSGSPWRTLSEVFSANKIESRQYTSKPYTPGAAMSVKNAGAPVKAGDTLMLRTGYHDTLNVSEYYNTDYITILAQPGQTPKLGFIQIRSASKWRVKGLTVSPEFMPLFKKRTLINFESHSWTGASFDCIAESCTAYTTLNTAHWTMGDWDTLSCNGISLPGNKMVARGNYFKNVNFGINVTGDSCLAEYNTVENFAGDGMRGLGNYETFQYNVIKNCYDVNANHDDGFQSWSVGDSGVGTGVVKGMTLRGNTIINYVDSTQPFRGTLQGIGCFDGIFEDWLVVNNVIITDHWHGITLLGAKNCLIINNTLVDQNTVDPGPPWMMVAAHKNGTPATGCLLRNNLTTALSCDSGVAVDHNIIVKNYDDFFVDYANFNLHLKPNCIAVDSGSIGLVPDDDRIGTPRPQGGRVDVGAYEFDKRINVEGCYRAEDPAKRGLVCFPNPFNPSINISVGNAVGIVRIAIYNMGGRQIWNILAAGGNTVAWNGEKFPSGVYLVRAEIGKNRLFQRIILQK